MSKQRVLSGIRATGRLHLGNYLGAVKGMLALQDDPKYETLYMIADLHTMTTPYDKESLSETTRDVFLDYLACGLDPEKSIVFVQSDLANLHAQFMLYLSTVVSVARMQHLPTFKEKVKQYPSHVTMALLNYPILMAADILIYKASKVPVGIDQEPHLEVTREIARKMNTVYATALPEPSRFATDGGYVPSLLGEGKMSKSVEGSYINLTDDLNAIRSRLAAAPTDSGQGSVIPTSGGVVNLLILVELFQGKKRRLAYEQQYAERGIRYQDLKEALAEAIYRELKPIQERRKKLEADPKYINQVVSSGAKKAKAIARKTTDEVKIKMGLA